MKFTVPLLPPSVNHNKKPRLGGGWYSTREVVAFVDAVCVFSRREPVTADYYELDITFYLPPSKHRLSSNDLDNFLKTGIDALAKAGVISNDGRVIDLHVHKRFVLSEQNARSVFTITERKLDEDEIFPEGTAPRAARIRSATRG